MDTIAAICWVLCGFFFMLISKTYIFVHSVTIKGSILNLELHNALLTSSGPALALVSLTMLSFGLCKQFSQTLVKLSACFKVRGTSLLEQHVLIPFDYRD